LGQVAKLSLSRRALLELRLKQKAAPPFAPSEPGLSTADIFKQVTNLSPAKQALLQLRLKERGEPAPDNWGESSLDGLDFDEEPPAPDWLIAPIAALPPLAEDEALAGPVVADPPERQDDTAADTAAHPDEIKSSLEAAPLTEAATASDGAASSWLESLRPAGDTLVDDKDIRTAEATGMLAGISTLLPAEKVAIPTTLTGDQASGLQQAAQEFHSIATEAPQPASLPSALSRREKLAGSLVRAALLLGFVILLAVPLLLGGQKLASDRIIPWSEPATGDSSEALDSQRRQLISEQLGIIDVQQPGSVALVSFDYSTATQGELQPLANAILGRLKGQGMRVISVSLEPEGANIAQQTIESILAEREQLDQYGQEMINLGFLPGRIAAVRGLAANQASLATIPDFKEGRTIADRPEWTDVQNLDQVDLVVTFADNPVTARWWVEQLGLVPQPEDAQRFILAATSASADPFLRPYRDSGQLDGLVSGINGAAAIEAGRREFGPARQMVDSLAIATIIIIIVIAAGIVVGWMPSLSAGPEPEEQQVAESRENEQSTP
jgi:hypothetical protein